MSVTDADRKKVESLLFRSGADNYGVAVDYVAAALAAEREKARAPFLALADELEREAGERNRIADRLPNQPAYHMEINRLVVAAEHQRRSAKQIRRRAAEES